MICLENNFVLFKRNLNEDVEGRNSKINIDKAFYSFIETYGICLYVTVAVSNFS